MMPLEYSGIIDEHMAVREKAGIFDVSHMGEIWVKGINAKSFLQRLTTNDLNRLQPGMVQYTCFPNGRGGIVDDLLVYYFDDRKYLLVVNASNIEKDFNWMVSQNTEGAIIENSSDSIAQIAVQGPESLKILQKLTPVDLSGIRYYTFTRGDFAGEKEVIISATGYTGSGGFELYFHNDAGPGIWHRIMEAGSSHGLKPTGLAARDTLRLEMGYCLYGNDINDSTSPIEAGLGWITKFAEGKDFIDRKLLEQQKNNGTTRRLAGFEMMEKGIPRQHYELVDANNNPIGEVTSGSISPVLQKGIGLGYIRTSHADPGNIIYVRIRDKRLKAQIVRLPFYHVH
jgi:aminomethyltransferase